MSSSTKNEPTSMEESSTEQQELVQKTASSTTAIAVVGDEEKEKNDSKKTEDETTTSKEGEKEEEEKEKKPAGPPPVPWSQLFKYADKWDITMYCIGGFCAFVAGAGMPAFSLIFGEILDVMTTNNDATSLNKLAMYMALVGVGRLVLGVFTIAFFMIPCERQSSRIRTLYVDALLRQEMAFHDKALPGALTASLVGDIQVYRNGINDKLAQGLQAFSMFLIGYGLGFGYSWRLTLVCMAVLPAVAIVGIVMRNLTVGYVTENRAAFSKAGEISDEAFQNFRTLQILGLEDSTVKKFAAALEAGRHSGLMKDVTINVGMGCIFFCMFGSYALTFWYSSVLVLNGTHEIGELVTVFFSLLIASFGLGQVAPAIGGLAEASGAIAKVFEVLDRQPEIVSGDKKIDDADFKGQITFENVDFRYPTKQDMPLLNDLNLTINAGHTVAFSGASGCGKSTFIGLVQRLYDPIGGRVLIDGVDLKELDLEWFRSKIGIVSQEPVLFSGTIKENVKFGKINATDDEVIAACKMAAIHDTIMTLPDGYDTSGGSVGSQLSGGQKQRIAIARALILKPKILILDEATSALDRQSEMEVQNAINKLVSGGDFTVLVIAHRLATIASADVIHFMERDDAVGSDIVESGSFKELMAKEGHFFSMASRQAKSGAAMMDDDEQEDGGRLSDLTANVSVSIPHQGGADKVKKSALDIDNNNNRAPQVGVNISGTAAQVTPAMPANTTTSETSLKNASITSIDSNKSNNKRQSSSILVDIPDSKLTEEEKKKKQREENALTEVKEKEEESVDASLLRVAGMLDGKKWMIFLGCFGSLLAGGQMPTYAVVFTKVIAILGSRNRDVIENDITFWLCMFVLIAGVALIANCLQSLYAVAGESLTNEMRIMTFRAILRQDATFFDMPGRDPGGLQGLLSGDCESVHQLFGPAVGPTIQLIGTLGAGLGISFYYSPRLAAVILSTLPVLALGGLLRSKIYQGFAAPLDEKNPAATIFGESMRNIRTVAAFNAGSRQRDAFEEADSVNLKEGTKVAWVGGIAFGFMQFGVTAIFALGLWYAGILMRESGLSFFEAFVSLMALIMAGMGSGESAGLLTRQTAAGAAAKRVFAVDDRVPDVNIYAEGGKDNSYEASPEHIIELKNTNFTYPARPKLPVLRGFSEVIKGSSSRGLIGLTGSGKSTIIALIARFYDPNPQKDSIEIDGEKLPNLDLLKWRNKMSAVMQEPSLFSGTVKENILLGVKNPEDISQEEIDLVIKRAALAETIEDWPDGLDTQCGFRGQMLSGGQRLRVAIARALLRKPDLLLLDEATSSLDNETEARVIEGIREMQKDHPMTTISVAHRLSTIKDCDKILLLDQGVVLESGSHQELMSLGQEYKKRWDLYISATEADSS